MLEPDPPVAQTHTRSDSDRSRPSEGVAQRRSTQRLGPPRSVSSMRTLMPLKLSSSQHTMQALSRTDYGDRQKMEAVDESDVSFDLAEALAKDLDESKAPFTSKSMTSGCPAKGLASTHVDGHEDDADSFYGPTIPRYSSPRFQRPTTGYQKNSRQVIDEQDVLAVAAERDAHIRYEGGDCSDSVSDSSAAIEQPSIRTRQQSVATAATSVSGRNSSFPSPKLRSPSPTSSVSFPKKPHQHRQGTWFDADDESAQSSEAQTDLPPRPAFYFHHRSAVSLTEADFVEMTAPDTRGAIRPSVSTNFHFPLRGPIDIQRPQTSSGIPFMERPRLVDIQPSVAVPKRRSSLKRTHGRLPSTSSLRYHRDHLEGNNTAVSYAGDRMRLDDNGHILNPSDSMTMLTTSCGRMVIDASRPSSVESSGEQLYRRMHSTSQSRLSIIDNTDFEEGEPPAEYTYPEHPPSRFRDLSQGNVHDWLDSGMGNRSATAPEVLPHSPSTPGIPLPPDVIETLRISLSCFPETMLLTSSLSIETIRTYSRKLRHRVGGGSNQVQHSHVRHTNDDERSIFSFSSQGTKPPKKWHLHRLVSSHKRDKHSPQGSHNQTEHKLPRSSFNSGSDPSSPVSPQHQHQPMMPDWAPVKRIFPAGSDYLCDALYAHIIVYNYLNTLYPVPIVNPVPQIKLNAPQNQPSRETQGHDLTRKVPKKAASILGMQGSPGGLTSPGHHDTNSGHHNQFLDNQAQAQSPGIRQMSSRRFQFPFNRQIDNNLDKMSLLSGGGNTRGGLTPSASAGTTQGHGSGGIETAVIRDLQAGLTRCIGLLVTTLEKGFSTGSDETTFLLEEQHQSELTGRAGEASVGKNGHVSPFLMRALCEVVRAAEGTDEGHHGGN